ncbi:hypothetical protein FAI40_02755 [Acetobacteraceae bacterium]|nr:hypothetical protein FAI40_02755 [Acetobacteraceae bacterium]
MRNINNSTLSINLLEIENFDHENTKTLDLSTLNFIFGSNGSGKTSISRKIKEQTEADYTDYNIHVFNIDFIKREIRCTSEEELTPVISFKEEIIEDQDRLKRKKEEFNELSQTITELNADVTNLESKQKTVKKVS